MEPTAIRKTFSRVGFSIVVFYLITYVVAIAASIVLNLVAPDFLMSGWASWLISYIPMYFIAMPVMFLVLKGVPTHTGGPLERKRISLPGLLAAGAAGWVIVLVINMAMLYLAAFIESLKGSAVSNALAETATNSNPWLNFFIVGIVAPVMEEYIFRKKLYDKLIVFGGKTYILVSALCFSLFHANFYQILYAFVLGLIFGTLFYKTGKLFSSIFAHMMINWMGAAGSTLVLTYGSPIVHDIYNILVSVIAVIGLIVIIWWLVKKRNTIGFAPAEVPLPSKGIVFANAGMIVMLVMFGAFILFSVLAPGA